MKKILIFGMVIFSTLQLCSCAASDAVEYDKIEAENALKAAQSPPEPHKHSEMNNLPASSSQSPPASNPTTGT